MHTVPSFCLVRCDSRPLAVAVDNVAEVLELDSLVRISLCPPQIAGLCAYHRQVVPVAAPPGDPSTLMQESPETRPSGKACRESVLILQTDQGFWGLKIDPGGTTIVAARPSRHEPVEESDGTVTVGLIRHGGTDHALLDAAATWRGLREIVVNWYVQIRESATTGAVP
jgi:CheW-like domain